MTSDKVDEIVIKSERGKSVRVGLIDYKAFISFALIAATALLALIDNEAWREFALMVGMSIAWWFKRGD